ncbi:unnamed protein product [Heligmosomoides polygyrus]|uniref:Uncharacterized protein n=1 Tax=Heligmosomoides polygyrus TaxID=6339 RepID=A0A183FST9_HELPZ|nr:unnamed protein product [Heligmosomoides polygyrus]
MDNGRTRRRNEGALSATARTSKSASALIMLTVKKHSANSCQPTGTGRADAAGAKRVFIGRLAPPPPQTAGPLGRFEQLRGTACSAAKRPSVGRAGINCLAIRAQPIMREK